MSDANSVDSFKSSIAINFHSFKCEILLIETIFHSIFFFIHDNYDV